MNLISSLNVPVENTESKAIILNKITLLSLVKNDRYYRPIKKIIIKAGDIITREFLDKNFVEVTKEEYENANNCSNIQTK